MRNGESPMSSTDVPADLPVAVPAIVFLLPQALVAAELASARTGGSFRWVSEGITARCGLLAVRMDDPRRSARIRDRRLESAKQWVAGDLS
jgi:hypothetical protein